MTPPPVAALDRRGFLRTLAAAAGSLAGGATLAACTPTPGPSLGASTPGTTPAAVRIGLLASSGADESLASGLQLALDEVGGEAAGRPLQLVRADAAAPALEAARALGAREGVDVLVSSTGGRDAESLAELAQAQQVLLLLTSVRTSVARQRRSAYVFRAAGTAWQVGYPLGEWVARNLARRVYLSAVDSPEGREAAAGFEDAFTRQGGSILGRTALPAGHPDYADHLAAVARARPDATFAFYGGADAVRFVQQYAAAGLPRDARLTGAGRLVDEAVLPAAGRAARGAITSLFWAPTLDLSENRRFVSAYRERYGQDPDVDALVGYDCARAVVEAVRRAGAAAPSRAQLAQALAGVELASPRGPFRFDPATHAVVHDVYIREVKDERGVLRNVVLDRVRDVRGRAESAA